MDPTRCFSLIYGELDEILDLVAPSEMLAHAWELACGYFIERQRQVGRVAGAEEGGGNGALPDHGLLAPGSPAWPPRRMSLNQVDFQEEQNLRDSWLRDMFIQADANGDRQLSLVGQPRHHLLDVRPA